MKVHKTFLGVAVLSAMITAQGLFARVTDLVQSVRRDEPGIAFAPQGRDQFRYPSSQMLHYKALDGMKYPSIYVLKTLAHVVEIYNLVEASPLSNNVRLITKPSQLADMQVSEFQIILADIDLKVHKKYAGARESFLAQKIETALKAVSQFPSFKGTPLVDQYKTGIAQRWTVSSPEQLSATIKFLRRNFDAQQIAPLAVKPPLLIDIIKNGNAVSDDDMTFLQDYFDLIDGLDPVVAKFYNDAHDQIIDYVRRAADAKVVGDTPVENIMMTIDKELKGLDVLKLTLKVAGGALTYAAIAGILKPILLNDPAPRTPDEANQRALIRNTLLATAGVLTSWYVYEQYQELQKSQAEAEAALAAANA